MGKDFYFPCSVSSVLIQSIMIYHNPAISPSTDCRLLILSFYIYHMCPEIRSNTAAILTFRGFILLQIDQIANRLSCQSNSSAKNIRRRYGSTSHFFILHPRFPITSNCACMARSRNGCEGVEPSKSSWHNISASRRAARLRSPIFKQLVLPESSKII